MEQLGADPPKFVVSDLNFDDLIVPFFSRNLIPSQQKSL